VAKRRQIDPDDQGECRLPQDAPGPVGNCLPSDETVSPTILEQMRQAAIIAVVLGIRQGIATANVMNPTGVQSVQQDQTEAQALLLRGNYEQAFEVATGFKEYFDIRKQGKATASTESEMAAVMMGHATGFNQAVETAKGESASGDKLQGFERFSKGLEALLKLASTAITVAGGVSFAGGRFGKPKLVSPVYHLSGRDIVVVETSVGRQAFYRSSGTNSANPGTWYPVDEVMPWAGGFNKTAYVEGPGLEAGQRLHRLGTEEFARISKKLGQMSIPAGQPVPAGVGEVEEMTMNRILDFFKARITPTTMTRPVADK
jgi:hypothetical protein